MDTSEWGIIKEVTDNYRQRILEMQIDKGESSAIAWALEILNRILILDDNKARKKLKSQIEIYRNNRSYYQS